MGVGGLRDQLRSRLQNSAAMASNDPFNFSGSKNVLPIPCSECGNNMYCFRRSPEGTSERQWFHCASCNNETQRLAVDEQSDAEIQADAESITGVGPHGAA